LTEQPQAGENNQVSRLRRSGPVAQLGARFHGMALTNRPVNDSKELYSRVEGSFSGKFAAIWHEFGTVPTASKLGSGHEKLAKKGLLTVAGRSPFFHSGTQYDNLFW
jgi:uncharacterized protein (DUF2342 family)